MTDYNSDDPTVALAQDLIRLPSVTPEDAGCQELLATRLKACGFAIKHLPLGSVKNLWARRGDSGPLLVFVGHTDVVPPGLLEDWNTPPFTPTIVDGFLYGRGAADMKGGLAAMVVAAEQFIAHYPQHRGSIAFLITSDEEGPAQDGTRKVVEYLQAHDETITWCIVGEPSSETHVGDTIKVGRRGSLNGVLTIHGKQGHIAYPQLADNPIHRSLAALTQLCAEQWDTGHPLFPSTSLQISNIHAGVGASNVIPGHIEITFNLRYSPAVTADQLQQRIYAILDQQALHYTIEWTQSGAPFLSPSGVLLTATQQAIQQVAGITPILSTGGGTSDGRFIAPLGCELLELGPCNATIHQSNEHICIADLIQVTQFYQIILYKLLVAI
jgi:succinyl-diaminopimelate desuccinylase